MLLKLYVTMGIYIIVNTQIYASSPECHWKGHYRPILANGTEGKCSPCSKCPPGKYVRVKCSRLNDTQCEKCPIGTFSSGGMKRNCTKCSSLNCPKGFKFVRCRRTKDSYCKCKKNHFLVDNASQCKRCSKCPAGQYMVKKCGANHDTECESCPWGTYLEMPSYRRTCKACKYCKFGEQRLQECTNRSNTVCGGCSSGFFRLQTTYECARCSDCYRDYPGYTVEVDDCRRGSNGSDNVCMPVAYPPYPSDYYLDVIDQDALTLPNELVFPPDSSIVSNVLVIVAIVLVSILLGILSVLAGVILYVKWRRKKFEQTKNPPKVISAQEKVKLYLTRHKSKYMLLPKSSNSEPNLTFSSKEVETTRLSYPCSNDIEKNYENSLDCMLVPLLHPAVSEVSDFSDLLSVSEVGTKKSRDTACQSLDRSESEAGTEKQEVNKSRENIFTLENLQNKNERTAHVTLKSRNNTEKDITRKDQLQSQSLSYLERRSKASEPNLEEIFSSKQVANSNTILKVSRETLTPKESSENTYVLGNVDVADVTKETNDKGNAWMSPVSSDIIPDVNLNGFIKGSTHLSKSRRKSWSGCDIKKSVWSKTPHENIRRKYQTLPAKTSMSMGNTSIKRISRIKPFHISCLQNTKMSSSKTNIGNYSSPCTHCTLSEHAELQEGDNKVYVTSCSQKNCDTLYSRKSYKEESNCERTENEDLKQKSVRQKSDSGYVKEATIDLPHANTVTELECFTEPDWKANASESDTNSYKTRESRQCLCNTAEPDQSSADYYVETETGDRHEITANIHRLSSDKFVEHIEEDHTVCKCRDCHCNE